MGTRSYIALQIEEDEYLTIFCHYNGYPDDNGAILAEHYDKQEKVESLIQLGDLYFLRSKLEPNPDLPHNHSTPQPNVTIAYNRDEGLMLSRLVDTFFSRTSWTMLLYAENHSISVA